MIEKLTEWREVLLVLQGFMGLNSNSRENTKLRGITSPHMLILYGTALKDRLLRFPFVRNPDEKSTFLTNGQANNRNNPRTDNRKSEYS